MSARERILGRARAALGNPLPPADVPPVMLSITKSETEARIVQFTAALEKLAGQVYPVADESAAAEQVRALVAGRLVFSTHPLAASTTSDVALASIGVTGAAFGLADTGSLVVRSSEEARLASLLPPVHIAVLRRDQILTGLDELLTVLPKPADANASMVIITGPSRTADIEQILVRGVHGPGELHVILM